MVKEVKIEDFARDVLLHGVKRVWYDEDVSERVADFYALWEFEDGGEARTFGGEAQYFYKHIPEGHKKDVRECVERMKNGEVTLPFIIIRLYNLRIQVWDGNRRCLALMRFRLDSQAPVKIPAFVLDYRERPY